MGCVAARGLRLAAGFAAGLPPLLKGGGTAEGRDGGIALKTGDILQGLLLARLRWKWK